MKLNKTFWAVIVALALVSVNAADYAATNSAGSVYVLALKIQQNPLLEKL